MVVNAHEAKTHLSRLIDRADEDLVLVTQDPAMAAYEVRTLAC